MKYDINTPTGERTIDIEWPTGHRRVAVALSGGLDSALLLWLYMQIEVPTGGVLYAINIDRGRNSRQFGLEMVDYLNNINRKSVSTICLTIDPALPHYKSGKPFADAIYKHGLIDCIIGGDTSNPECLSDNEYAPRRPSLEQQFIEKWKLPFLHCDKTHIVALIQKLELDYLYSIFYKSYLYREQQ